MTDQTIPADKVRAMAARFRQQMETHTPFAECVVWERAAEAVEALLPPPTRPTLAGMTREERDACQWMQADTESEGRTVILQPNASVGRALMLDQEANLAYAARNEVTPRPDLPRMEWPGDQKPAPALPEGWRLADHPCHGRIIVTNPTPNRDGYVYVVLPVDDPMGYDWHFLHLDELTYLDTSPAPSTLAVGSEWDNVDALARACEESGRDQIVVADKDGDVFVWGVDAEWWETGLPGCDYAPHTIIHAGKKADQ